MATPRLQLQPHTPLALRLFDRIPLPPLWSALCVGLAIFAFFLLLTGLLGPGPGRMTGQSEMIWMSELIVDVFVGLPLAISIYTVRGSLRDLEALRPALAPGVDPERLQREILRYDPRILFAVGLPVALFSGFGSVPDTSLGWLHPETLWLFARNFLNWWIVSRAMVLELMLARAFSRVGDQLGEVDLLDRAPLAPFGARALRNVLLWMLLAAFLSLLYVFEGVGALLPLGLACLCVFALTAFALPLLGAHARIRQLKQRELERVRVAIRSTRERVLASGETGSAGGRLADLVAYEGRIAAVPEWPVDASVLLRLGLYLAIGLGSWIGAALVERVLETALG